MDELVKRVHTAPITKNCTTGPISPTCARTSLRAPTPKIKRLASPCGYSQLGEQSGTAIAVGTLTNRAVNRSVLCGRHFAGVDCNPELLRGYMVMPSLIAVLGLFAAGEACGVSVGTDKKKPRRFHMLLVFFVGNTGPKPTCRTDEVLCCRFHSTKIQAVSGHPS